MTRTHEPDAARFNGFKNVETFDIAVVFDNDRAAYDVMRRLVAQEDGDVHMLALAIKDYVERMAPIDDAASGPGIEHGRLLRAQLLGSALSRVDWREVAQHYIDTFREIEESEVSHG